MAQQSFLWTALPNGFTPDGTGLRVSVLLSPRLEPQNLAPRLSSFFPDWKDWPTTLSKAKFTISYGGASVAIEATQTAGANRVDDSLGLPDSRCWQALFLDTLPVNSYQYKDLSNNGVLSYDTTAVASLVQGLYSNLARNADGNMPLVSDIADDSGWTAVVGAVRQIDRHFVNRETGLRDPRSHFAWFFDGGQIDTRGAARIAQVLGLFQLFHTPPATPKPVNHRRRDDPRISAGWLEYERAQLPDSKDIAKKFDFHQMVSTMNSYPTLLRRLGLVVDFIVDSSAFQPSSNQLLSASADFPPGALSVTSSRQASPATHTLFAADKFQAVSNPLPQATDHRVADGLLELDPNRFDVIQMDVDGAGLKVMNFARSLARYHPAGPDADSDDLLVPRVDTVTRFEKELGAPALRTAGMMLVQKSRWSMLKDRFVVNQARNAAAEDVFQNQPNAKPPELWAEDIVRGYRVDVWDRTTGKWRSLCQRTATYVLGDDVEVTPDNWEETAVRLAATKSSDPASNQNLLYLHEALVSWAGWSLAAPIPGRAVDPKDGVDKTQAETSAELPPGIKFKSKFNALPLSLPRLRFGRSYWMRARVVDLAGNSLAPQEKSFGAENPAKYARTFLRYEPVAAPIVALVRPKGGKTEPPAEGESIARMAIRSFNDKPADNTKTTKQVARRFAVPPQSSARDAEQHGKLDASGKVDDATFNLLANLKDLDAKDPNAALCEEILPMKGPLDRHPVKTVFATYRDGQSLTYLPDPLAEEVAVRIFDHPNFKDTDIITIPLYPNGAWPEAQPFKIKVFEDATAKPSFVTTEWTLMVPLPKAIRAKVRLSMKLPDAALDMLGVFQWLTAAEQGKLRRMAHDGQHWMLSPWRTIEVVHAVQRPLITPEIAPIKVARNMFATSAIPQLKATCSLKSTDRLDLLAEWHEPQDDPDDLDSDQKQADRRRRDVAFTVKITDEKSYARRVNHTLGGFAEHSIEADDVIGINVATERQRLAPKAHEFHDTRYRRISYRFDATTKFREFLPNKILTDGGPDPTDANIKASGPAVVTWVPSSAPPPAPKVLYVVPTYGWERSADGKLKSSWRRGGGLRVYLDRPWNASGYGEMLAVVLPPAGFTGNPESEPAAAPYKRSITQWGNDPIWVSPFVSGIAPKRANFPLARTAPDTSGAWLPEGAPADEKDQMPGNFAVTGLTVPGNGFAAPPVEVAPHDVFYSPERRLWYCDIEIDQRATYYPFIRLALARYQPTSITGAHLSHVVLADFMTLASDRWLSVTRTNAKSCHVSVYGNRYSDSSGHAEASRARPMSVIDPLTRRAVSLTPATVSATTVVEVWLERLDEPEGEDFGWKRVADLSVQPSPRLARRTRKLSQRQKQRAKTLVTARNFKTLLKENLVDQVFVLQPIWDGDITLPAAPGRGNRYRLVIAEYEEYIVDDELPYDQVPTKKDRRLVFVEHVELS